jgi:CcmD family protein
VAPAPCRGRVLVPGEGDCMRKLRARTLVLGVMALCLIAVGAAGVVAQGASATGAQPSAQLPDDQFVPVKTLPGQEQLPAPILVMTAYAFVWAALLVYVWTVWRRLMKVEREMHELAGRLGEKR